MLFLKVFSVLGVQTYGDMSDAFKILFILHLKCADYVSFKNSENLSTDSLYIASSSFYFLYEPLLGKF